MVVVIKTDSMCSCRKKIAQQPQIINDKIVAFKRPFLSKKTKAVRKTEFIAIPRGTESAALAANSFPTVNATNNSETSMVLGSNAITPPTLVPSLSAPQVEIDIHVPAMQKESSALM